jgi:hypothetical protein
LGGCRTALTTPTVLQLLCMQASIGYARTRNKETSHNLAVIIIACLAGTGQAASAHKEVGVMWECGLLTWFTHLCAWLEHQYASSYGCGAFSSQLSLILTGAATEWLSSSGCALLLLLAWPTGTMCRGLLWQGP